jgi:hypothetical protein
LALRSRPVGGGFKPPRAALAEDRCGERRGKGVPGGCQVGIGKTVRKSRSLLAGVAGDVSLEGKLTSKPGRLWSASGRAQRVPADWLGGVRHEGDVSPICCSRMEREKACPGTALWGERERFERMNRKRLSTDPGRAGGLVRSSGEAPAGRGGGGAKGPGRRWFRSSVNRCRRCWRGLGGTAWAS